MARYNTDGSSALAPDDPYNDMEGAEIRPNFRVIDGGKSNNSKPNSTSNRNNLKVIDGGKSPNQSRDLLRNSEESALSGKEQLTESAESGLSGGGLFTGKGKDNNSKKGKAKGKLKTKIAGALIVAMLTGGGVFLGTTNSMLGPAIEALFTEQTDTQYASANRRSVRLMRYAVEGDEVIKTNKWTGAKKYGKMSKSFKKKLANNGITVEGSGKSAKLVFTQDVTDSNGKVTTVTKDVPADDFAKAINSDVDFREAFQTARRGRVATFFDDAATAVLKRLGISRNLFEKYKRTSDAEVNTKTFRETMTGEFDGGESSARQKGTNEYTEKNEAGEDVTKREPIDADESAKHSNTSVADAETKAKNMLDGVANKFTAVGSFTCTITRVMSMISVMVAANEIYQSINYFMGLTENVSKMKAGKGEESAINEVMNFLSTSSTTETNKYSKLTITDTGGDTGTVSGGKNIVKQTGAPLQSNGMQMILANADKSNEENQLFSLERLNNASSSPETESKCNAADSVSAVVSISTTIATLGTAAIASTIWSFVKGAVTSVAISVALSFIVPTIAKALFTNAFETATGIPAGALFAKGGSAANTRLGRNASGQSLSSKEAAVAYNKMNQEVIALDAEIDRKTLSPFDITNKNTFLGSIAYSLLPVTTSSNVTNLSSLLSVAGKSLGSLMSNGVSAAGEDTSYMTKFGICTTLALIGAEGDNYCNPVTSTDISTIDMDPNDEKYQEVIAAEMVDGSCDDEGNGCKISLTGDLAKYISYCANRDSPFGVVDQNILGALTTSDGLASFRGIVGAIPLVGDGLDLVDAAQNEVNMPWATGERCGNTEKNADFWNNQGRYYQRFIEDTRLLEQFGAFEGGESALSVFNREYEEAHPVENESYVAYMSRISGLLPENVETTLAFIEYFEYLNEYDPTERIAMTDHPSIVETSDVVIARATSESRLVETSPQTVQYILAIFQPKVVYTDIRNRNFAA